MPSTKPLPTIGDLIQAGRDAVTGQRDRFGDVHDGAKREHIFGPTAILFARQADRDADTFGAIYFDDADGDELTALIEGRYQTSTGTPLIPRIRDTKGQGTCTFVRPNATAGGGDFWTGTRIKVTGASPRFYEVASDTAAGATATTVTVPIQAFETGTGNAISSFGGLSLEDPVYDPSWQPVSLTCQDGTDFEEANAYRARSRAFLIANRNGYLARMVQVCQDAGASYVVGFRSDYGLQPNQYEYDINAGVGDMGLNAIYVADASFSSPPSLIDACAVALDGARVLGADLWVGGLVRSPLSIAATATLVDDPSKMPVVAITAALIKATMAYFAPTQSGYLYKRTAIEAAMRRSSAYVQTVSFTAPTSDPTISPMNFPASLARYTVAPNNINLTFAPPV